MIAKPFSPGNAFPAEEVARERITFDKAMIGSCTNGSYDDLLSAALVLVAARARGLTQGRAGVRRVSRIGRRQAADRAARSAARRRVDRRRLPRGGRRDSPLVVRPVLRPGPGRARRRASARSPRSIATGRTGWDSAAKAIWRARRSSRRRRSSATWRRRASSGSSGTRRSTGYRPRFARMASRLRRLAGRATRGKASPLRGSEGRAQPGKRARSARANAKTPSPNEQREFGLPAVGGPPSVTIPPRPQSRSVHPQPSGA